MRRIIIFIIGLIIGLILLDWGFSWLSAPDTLLNICSIFIICFGFCSIAIGIFPNLIKRNKNKIDNDGMEY